MGELKTSKYIVTDVKAEKLFPGEHDALSSHRAEGGQADIPFYGRAGR